MKTSKLILIVSLITALFAVPAFAGNGKGAGGGGGQRSGGPGSAQCDGSGRQAAVNAQGAGQGLGQAARERIRQRLGECPNSDANRAAANVRAADRPAKK